MELRTVHARRSHIHALGGDAERRRHIPRCTLRNADHAARAAACECGQPAQIQPPAGGQTFRRMNEAEVVDGDDRGRRAQQWPHEGQRVTGVEAAQLPRLNRLFPQNAPRGRFRVPARPAHFEARIFSPELRAHKCSQPPILWDGGGQMREQLVDIAVDARAAVSSRARQQMSVQGDAHKRGLYLPVPPPF